MSHVFVKYGHDGRQLTYDILESMQLGRQLNPAMTFGIKPNLVLAKPSESGATTDPQVTAGIIEYLLDHGCSRITIMESSWLGDSTTRAFAKCGYEALSQRYGVPLVDLKRDSTYRCRVDDLDLDICRTPTDVDFLINVPVLKAHCQTHLTCALKNLKGCIPDTEKRRYHTLGLHRPIAALNKALRQSLVVVDGIIGDLTFEEGGTPVTMDRVIAGQDPTAVDAYCASLLGLSLEQVPYIKMAADLGVGTSEYSITALNSGSEASLHTGSIGHLTKCVAEDQACSACLGSLIHALRRLQDNDHPAPRQTLHIGQGYRGRGLPGVGVGSCTQGASVHVPGCPPSAAQILEVLTNMLSDDDAKNSSSS